MKKEIWKDIIGYEGLYQVSNLGRVKSLGNGKSKKEKILKQGTNSCGYYQIKLYQNGKYKTYKIHRLVAQTFLDNPNNYYSVNHRDENKQNNCIENLEWCTQEYNVNYGTRNERQSKTLKERKINVGKKLSKEHIEKLKLKNIGNQYNSKPIVQIDNNDLIIGVYDSAIQASNELGIDNSSIVKCCKGKRNSVGGFKWKYLEELKKAG